MGERYLARIRSRQVSTMLQGATRNLLPYATARQNIAFARLSLSRPSAGTPCSTPSCSTGSASSDQADQVVSTMSGGQRQRLALACAVATSPRLLLADEPTSQLSHEDRDHVLHLIHSLGDDFGTTIVVVTHQPEVAATFPRTVTMKGGRVGAEGRERLGVRRGGRGRRPAPARPRRGRVAARHPGALRGRRPGPPARHPAPTWGGHHPHERPRRSSDVTYVAGRTLLDDVSLTFPAGKVTACPGRAARARPPCSRSPAGCSSPPSGTASYDGASTCGPGTGDPRPEVAFVLQVYGLVPILSARENVSIALRARGVRPADADEEAEAALARFGIADLGERQVEELSGGQMQRVACARGFVVGADMLLADEPTSELDEGNRGVVLAELRAEAARGAVVVVATHDPAVVEACDLHYRARRGPLVLTIEVRSMSRVAPRRLESPGCPDDARADDRGGRRWRRRRCSASPLAAGTSPAARRTAAAARCGRRPEHRRRAGGRPPRGDRPGAAARHPRAYGCGASCSSSRSSPSCSAPRSAWSSVRSARSSPPGAWLDEAAAPLGRTALLTAARHRRRRPGHRALGAAARRSASPWRSRSPLAPPAPARHHRWRSS